MKLHRTAAASLRQNPASLNFNRSNDIVLFTEIVAYLDVHRVLDPAVTCCNILDYRRILLVWKDESSGYLFLNLDLRHSPNLVEYKSYGYLKGFCLETVY